MHSVFGAVIGTSFRCGAEGCWFESRWIYIFFILKFLLASPSSHVGEASTNEIMHDHSHIVHAVLDTRYD